METQPKLFSFLGRVVKAWVICQVVFAACSLPGETSLHVLVTTAIMFIFQVGWQESRTFGSFFIALRVPDLIFPLTF